MPTPNYGWNTPILPAPNNVPADMLTLATQVDASLKEVETRLSLAAGASYGVVWDQVDNTALSIGNGTLEGRYLLRGMWVFYMIRLTRGSTTNAGSAAYRFTLPVAPRVFAAVQGSGYATSGGTSAEIPLSVRGVGANRIVILAPTGRVSNTLPGGWTAGNEIFISGMYERA